MPRIKKSKDGNQYLLTDEGMWVRDFTRPQVPYVDLNDTITSGDHLQILRNEVRNRSLKMPWLDSENFSMRHVVIVSDGYDFEKKHEMLASLPREFTIIAVNGALKRWSLKSREPNWYLINNPYEEAMRFLPKGRRNLPRCIASVRANTNFLASYDSNKYKYYPVNEGSYASIGSKDSKWHVDDYRNPVCAAICIAYRLGAESFTLFCCDDSFKDERPGAVRLEHGLYAYPQQIKAQNIIDGMFFWISYNQYNNHYVFDQSSSKKLQYATYIDEKDFPSFFNKAGEKNE